MSRPLRIILKPYSLQKSADRGQSEGHAYWRATTDFPASRNGKTVFGIGIDKMTALAACLTYCPRDIRESFQKFGEKDMYPMPDQMDFTFWQLNIDGSKPTKQEWLADRKFYNTFGHLPND